MWEQLWDPGCSGGPGAAGEHNKQTKQQTPPPAWGWQPGSSGQNGPTAFLLPASRWVRAAVCSRAHITGPARPSLQRFNRRVRSFAAQPFQIGHRPERS